MKIFLDDERFPVDDTWVIVRTVEEAIECVKTSGFPSYVSFDNDLGEGMKEGWRFAQWLIDYDLDTGLMPDDFGFYAHSRNPVRQNDIMKRLHNYLEYRKNLRVETTPT